MAVFLPTPAREVRLSISDGNSPLNRSNNALVQSIIFFALFLKNPVVLISCSISDKSACAKASRVGYFLKSVSVTIFTLSSVH